MALSLPLEGVILQLFPLTKRQIIKIRTDLEKEDSYFIGSKVVRENYENQTGEKVSKSYVDRVLKEAGMVKSQGKKRKGRSKYIRPEKWGIATRIEGQTTEETITALKEILE